MTTDKIGHGYEPIYRALFTDLASSHVRDEHHLEMVEVGVANGDSRDFWAELASDSGFESLLIVGVDRNPNAGWPLEPFGDPYIHVANEMLHADQEDPGLAEKVLATSGRVGLFDLIVDDGGHQYGETKTTFLNLWPLVLPGGVYVIEDWSHGGISGVAGCNLFPFAQELLVTLLPLAQLPATGVECIEYHPGLIILWKLSS